MDQSKEELLGTIQRLNTRAKQQSADLKGQRESLKEIDDELPAKKILNDLQAKATAEMERLKDQRNRYFKVMIGLYMTRHPDRSHRDAKKATFQRWRHLVFATIGDEYVPVTNPKKAKDIVRLEK